jgi:hypothetical protein
VRLPPWPARANTSGLQHTTHHHLYPTTSKTTPPPPLKQQHHHHLHHLYTKVVRRRVMTELLPWRAAAALACTCKYFRSSLGKEASFIIDGCACFAPLDREKKLRGSILMDVLVCHFGLPLLTAGKYFRSSPYHHHIATITSTPSSPPPLATPIGHSSSDSSASRSGKRNCVVYH